MKKLWGIFGLLLAVGWASTCWGAYSRLDNDRILLMNDSTIIGGQITDQGYIATNRTAKTYWIHGNEKTTSNLGAYKNLLVGKYHTLMAQGGRTLWHLANCRAGSSSVLNASRNSIPWGKSSKGILNGETGITVAQAPTQVGTVSMLDTLDSSVTSPYYEEGIGTIYFDAVNALVSDSKSEISLEIATNVLSTAQSAGITLENVQTNEYDQLEWQIYPLDVYSVQNCATLVPNQFGVSNLLLRSTAGYTNYFYRTRTTLNYHGPIRFRIRRTAVTGGSLESALIQVDNIIASPPPAYVEMHRYGSDFDADETGVEVMGLIGDFNQPFLSITSQNVRPQIWCSYYSNSASSSAVKLKNPKMVYRWRYLNQKAGPWKEIPFDQTEYSSTKSTTSNLVGTAALDMSSGVGDIEYFFTGTLDVPYYAVKDYTQTGVLYGAGWAEGGGALTNAMQHVQVAELPTQGKDYFSRVREGDSSYKWMRLQTSVMAKGSTNVVEKAFPMELVGDHLWRTHYYVSTNAADDILRFHFKGLEYQTNQLAGVYHVQTNNFYSDLASPLPYLPFTSLVNGQSLNDVSLKLDTGSTHLLIEFNDELMSFSVSHAAYQNFNAWTDAVNGFRGNALYDEAMPTNGAAASGVSSEKQNFTAEMAEWPVTNYYDPLWEETFDVEDDDPTYPYEQHFSYASSPNGWNVENGYFVKNNRGSPSGHAVQLDGAGKGTMTLLNSTVPGVEEVRVNARVAQLPSFDSFATYIDGGTCTNYGISAKLTMSQSFLVSNKDPKDISTCEPSVSLVGYARGTKGCYEFRMTRSGQDLLRCELVKWTQQSGAMVPTVLASNVVSRLSTGAKAGPGQPLFNNFNNMLIPTTGNIPDLHENWTTALFSLYTKKAVQSGQIVNSVQLDCWLSTSRNNKNLDADYPNMKRVLVFEDMNPGPLVKGSYGMGSTDCAAAIGNVCIHPFENNNYNSAAQLSGIKMIGTSQSPYFQEDWEMMYDRWRVLTASDPVTGVLLDGAKWKNTGLSAVIPTNQTLRLYVADATMNWSQVTNCELSVASFSTNTVIFKPYVTGPHYVQLRTGSAEANVTLSDLRVKSWDAADRGTANYSHYGQWSYTQSAMEASVDASGGNYEVMATGTNGYLYVFKTPGDASIFKVKSDMEIDRLLVVGGGGAGGWVIGGGGGGGGVLEKEWTSNPLVIKKDASLTVKVGAGGNNYPTGSVYMKGGNGGESSVSSPGLKITASGGGGGGQWNNNGTSGGSGGGRGGASVSNSVHGVRTSGALNQGNSGGLGYGSRAGGGGGASLDADGQGHDGDPLVDAAGAGGQGRASDITGEFVYYGGGGGGGAGKGSASAPGASLGGAGGLGGGGSGLNNKAPNRTATADGNPIDGQNGLGGGGGGGCFQGGSGTMPGGKGGSGVVIMRVKTSPLMCTLQPSRGSFNENGHVQPMGLRSPFLANGISMMSFSYINADINCILLAQICTNCTDFSLTSTFTSRSPEDPRNDWVTIKEWDFSTNRVDITDLKKGTLSFYQSYRAPVCGLLRLVVAPRVIRKARSVEGPECLVDYGKITITSINCYDEPPLDTRSWWGWNVHTEGWDKTPYSYSYLMDSPTGLSGMLNFSALKNENDLPDARGISLGEKNVAEYAKNNPFIQTPALTNGIGQVSFRARTFDANPSGASWLTLYGTVAPDVYQIADPDMWTKLAEFEITNNTYQSFLWKTTDDNVKLQAVRLEVNAARHGRSPGQGVYKAWEKPQVTPIERVCVDEISVSEPIVPRLVFRDVYPFRSKQLREDALVAVTNIASESEQPITGESWGLQATVEPQQMSKQLDTDSVRVFASFYVGNSPWGYEQWKDRPGVQVVELPRMSSNLVFRAHISNPASIQQPLDRANTVQFMVWATFRDNTGVEHKHYMDGSEWGPPNWYYGLQDLNIQYGAGLAERFSAYSIIDTISPRRAWINEVNTRSSLNTDEVDKRNQFIEFAVPQHADLTGWYFRLTGSQSSTFSNRVMATFGYDNALTTHKAGTKQGVDCTNNYTFIALRSPMTTNDVIRSKTDGVWNSFQDPSVNIGERGALFPTYPYAISLIRPSGIVEHQTVIEGRNDFEATGLDVFADMASGTNLLARLLKAQGPQSGWFFAGRDLDVGTLGVYRSHGEDASCWTNRMQMTPGELNRLENGQVQNIDPKWFLLPNGTNVWIYSNVLTPMITQNFGGATNMSVVLVVGKGDRTNVVYNVAPWYEIGSCTTNGVEIASVRGRGGRRDGHRYVLDLGQVEESMTVNVDAQADQAVVDAGLPRNDPYYPAVMDWLSSRVGNDRRLYHSEFWPMTGAGQVQKTYPMSIKDMYWLDIPPNEEGWILWGGMGTVGDPSNGNTPTCLPIYYRDPATGTAATNVLVTMTLMITNRIQNIARKPDHMQGLEPGSSSYNYAVDYNNSNWTSATFKITGALQKPDVSTVYKPLRWFVFGPDSFDNNYQAIIEIVDPFLPWSPAANYGWGPFKEQYPIWYKWTIDGNGPGLESTEMLNQKSLIQ